MYCIHCGQKRAVQRALIVLTMTALLIMVQVITAQVVEPNWVQSFSDNVSEDTAWLQGAIGGFDMDGDGNREFVVQMTKRYGTFSGPDLALYEATGDNTYQQRWSVTHEAIQEQYVNQGVAVGDSDGDGNLEIISGNVSTTAADVDLYIYEYDPALNGGQIGASNPPITPTVTLDTGSLGTFDCLAAVQVGDLDNDGNKEILIGTRGTGEYTYSLLIYESTGNNSYAAPISMSLEDGVCYISTVEDIDSDGKNEVAVLAGSALKTIEWNGTTPPAVEQTIDAHGGGADDGSIRFFDIDGNGTKEIIATDNQPRGTIKIYEVTGPDTYVIDETAGLFNLASRLDELYPVRLPGKSYGTIIWGYDVGTSGGTEDLQLNIADHIGPQGSFLASDFTALRNLVQNARECEGLDIIDSPGTLDGDDYVDLLYTLRGIDGGGTPTIVVLEYIPPGPQTEVRSDNWTIYY